MTNSFKDLRSAQLDELLAAFRPAASIARPASGWIRAVRDALGMSADQLAKRVGLRRTTIATLESSEARKAITLERLERLASAMGCRLVYGLVPENAESLEELLRQQALSQARRQLSSVSHTMRLEAQGLAPERERRQLERLAGELLAGSRRRLWR